MHARDLVTGGSGYFGSILVRKLLASGHRVRVLDLLPSPNGTPQIEVFQGDVRDGALARRACEGVDCVYHAAALVPVARDAQAIHAVSHSGTRALLDAARAAGVRKVVHLSSSAVFGAPTTNPVNEQTPLRPRDPYGKAKLAAEWACREYQEQGLDISIVRPRTIMGPGRLGIMQVLFEWVRRGQRIPVLGAGDNRYQFVHADDLTSAVVAVARRPGCATYNIGGAGVATMRQTLEGLVSHAQTGAQVVSVPARWGVRLMRLVARWGGSPLAEYHALMYGRSLYFDPAKAQQELGYVPVWDGIASFCQSYDWYVQHRVSVSRESSRSHHSAPVRQGVLRWLGWGLDVV